MSGLAGLSDADRQAAMRRFEILRPHLEHEVPLTRVATDAEVPLRTVQRWLARYQSLGLIGLARTPRRLAGRRIDPELVRLVEGLALANHARRSRRSRAELPRLRPSMVGPQPHTARSIPLSQPSTPAMLTLAHDGRVALRDKYELVYRRQSERPNTLWQVDHTELDILVVDSAGASARPWLTVVLDGHSRAVPGYTVGLGAPSALNTSLTLRQAIWTKPDPGWPICGIPEALYVDHGSDFTSDHLAQVAADLKFEIIHSTVARPQGRGKGRTLLRHHQHRTSRRPTGAPDPRQAGQHSDFDIARARRGDQAIHHRRLPPT